MTQKEKELLSKDLCARLMYRVKCFVPVENCIMELTGKRLNYFCFHKEEWGYDYSHEFEVVLDPLNDSHNGYIVKPYLRPLSSMTKKETKELFKEIGFEFTCNVCGIPAHYNYEFAKQIKGIPTITNVDFIKVIDWLNAHHFDYRGLIEKGLAIEAPEGMYN